MERLKDVSEWFTPERVEADEALGAAATEGGYYDYARYIERVCKHYHLTTVTEVGCGAGWVPSVLSKDIAYTVGIDNNEHMLYKAVRRCPGVTFKKCDIRRVDSLGLSSDLVCSFGVMKHFALDEWASVLAEVLALGKYGLFTQHVFMDARASVDVPGCDADGVPQYHDIWVCYTDLDQAIADAGHQILEFDDKFRFDGTMQAPEAMIVTKALEIPKVSTEIPTLRPKVRPKVKEPRKKK